jgi:hypothetical protein
MGKARTLTGSLIQYFESSRKSFSLPKPVKGWSFTFEKAKLIPAGDYVTIEPDSRDKSRVVISNKRTYEMYSIARLDIPK